MNEDEETKRSSIVQNLFQIRTEILEQCKQESICLLLEPNKSRVLAAYEQIRRIPAFLGLRLLCDPEHALKDCVDILPVLDETSNRISVHQFVLAFWLLTQIPMRCLNNEQAIMLLFGELTREWIRSFSELVKKIPEFAQRVEDDSELSEQDLALEVLKSLK